MLSLSSSSSLSLFLLCFLFSYCSFEFLGGKGIESTLVQLQPFFIPLLRLGYDQTSLFLSKMAAFMNYDGMKVEKASKSGERKRKIGHAAGNEKSRNPRSLVLVLLNNPAINAADHHGQSIRLSPLPTPPIPDPPCNAGES